MSEPFLSEIKLMAFNFPPKGWAQCNGQFLPINQNQALFSLLGTTYGGNGQTTFALPNLRGRVPIYTGNGHTSSVWLRTDDDTGNRNVWVSDVNLDPYGFTYDVNLLPHC